MTAEDAAWLEQPDVQRALKIMRDAARIKPSVLRPGDNLELDLGLDSMQRVELLVALEQEIGGDLEESRLTEIYTVRELVDAVCESAASGNLVLLARSSPAGAPCCKKCLPIHSCRFCFSHSRSKKHSGTS